MKRQEMEKSSVVVCLGIQAKLKTEKQKVANCFIMPSTNLIFQVNHKMDNLIVDLDVISCTYSKWDLCGIPCCHEISCISFLHKNAKDFSDDCYKMEVYLRAYSGFIPPCVGGRHWPRIELQLNPPPINIGPGWPRKIRRKYPHENPKKLRRLTKHGIEMSCSVCKSKQHTRRKFPDKDRVVEPTHKRPKGRPRKDGAPPSSSQASPSSDQLGATAQLTRTRRGGRVIRGGRGSKGGRRNACSNIRSLNFFYYKILMTDEHSW